MPNFRVKCPIIEGVALAFSGTNSTKECMSTGSTLLIDRYVNSTRFLFLEHFILKKGKVLEC